MERNDILRFGDDEEYDEEDELEDDEELDDEDDEDLDEDEDEDEDWDDDDEGDEDEEEDDEEEDPAPWIPELQASRRAPPPTTAAPRPAARIRPRRETRPAGWLSVLSGWAVWSVMVWISPW